MIFAFILLLAVLVPPPPATEQPPAAPAPPPPSVTRIDKDLYAIGRLRINTKKRELSMPATVNSALTLEFVANTRDGLKAYESALTVDTDAISFNTALLLLGLDPKNARVPTEHFDAIPPSGDPVEMFVDWPTAKGQKHVRVEELLFDRRTNQTL